MAQVVNTNSLSLIAQNNINKNQSALSSSIKCLSSGLRINNAKDDAAGQVAASRSTPNIRGLTQAACNTNDDIPVTQITEGTLPEINSNLQHIRELTVQATARASPDPDPDSIQDGIKPRLDEIDRVSGQTQSSGVNVLAKDGSMKIQAGVNDDETITVDLKKIDSDALGLSGFNVNGKGTITNKAVTVSDLTSAGAKLNTMTGLYDLKTENTLLTADAVFDRLGNGDKVTAGGVDYTHNVKSGDSTTTKSTAGTGIDAVAQAAGSASRRDALVATLYANVGKSVNGSYTIKDGTVSFETDLAGNTTIGRSQVYVGDAGNSTTNNAGSAAKADMKALPKAASEGNDGTSLIFSGTEYTIAEATPATTTPIAPLIPGGITYQATASKDVISSEIKAVAATPSITFNSDVLSKTIGFAVGESSDVVKSHMDDKGGITNVADYTASHGVNKDNGSVIVTGYASAADTNKDYAPATGTAVNVNSAGKITTETTSAGSTTTNPLTALGGVVSPIDKFRPSLGAIQDRLDSAAVNLNNTIINLPEAQSRIQDADYATEASNMSKVQITQQVGNSVLVKANQVLQQVLSLLQG